MDVSFCKLRCGEEFFVVELVPPDEVTVKVMFLFCVMVLLCLFRCDLLLCIVLSVWCGCVDVGGGL